MKKKPDQSAKDSAKPMPAKYVPKHGRGKLLTGGKPGNKGGGRTPDEFKRRMAEMASAEEVLAYLGACLRGDHGPQAAVQAHKHVTERGYGRVPQDVDLRTPDGPIEVIVTRRIVKASADD